MSIEESVKAFLTDEPSRLVSQALEKLGCLAMFVVKVTRSSREPGCTQRTTQLSSAWQCEAKPTEHRAASQLPVRRDVKIR